jgi:hypothetical protein
MRTGQAGIPVTPFTADVNEYAPLPAVGRRCQNTAAKGRHLAH